MNYDTLASQESVSKTIDALKKRMIEAESVATGAEALERIKALIPKGESLTNGASKTLEQIGFIDYLKFFSHGWHNLKEAIVAEKNPENRGQGKFRRRRRIRMAKLGFH